MTAPRQSESPRPVLFIALALSIPAFYLVLSGASAKYRNAGSLFYALVALMLAIDTGMHIRESEQLLSLWDGFPLDMVILLGALASAWPMHPPVSATEWMLRLAFCSIVFIRLSMLLAKWVAPRHILHVLAIALGLLAIAGGGFYWIDPKVNSYADGLWLAFVTGATVGYGDMVPSTPASRIFAGFIVLLGYAVFSLLTATIAAIFVGEDDKRSDRELQADMRSLREEVAALRVELRRAALNAKEGASEATGKD